MILRGFDCGSPDGKLQLSSKMSCTKASANENNIGRPDDLNEFHDSDVKSNSEVDCIKANKKKRKGPWDVKVGSVVAVRQFCPNMMIVKVCKKKRKAKELLLSGTTDGEPAVDNSVRQEEDQIVEEEWIPVKKPKLTWVQPVSGRDEGLALIGRYILFRTIDIASPRNTKDSQRSASAKIMSNVEISDSKAREDVSWLTGEVVAVQYPPSKEQNQQGIIVVGVIVDNGALQSLSKSNSTNINPSMTISDKSAIQVKLKAVSTNSIPPDWRIMRMIQPRIDGNLASEVSDQTVANNSFLKISEPLYVGDGFDSSERQEENYSWILKHNQSASGSPSYEGISLYQSCEPPVWHGEVLSVSKSEIDKNVYTEVTLKRVILPEETRFGRKEHHEVDEIFEETSKKKAELLYRVNIDYLIVVGRSLVRPISALDSPFDLRMKIADTGQKPSASRPTLFAFWSYSEKKDLYRPLISAPPSINLQNINRQQHLEDNCLQHFGVNLCQCHFCHRIVGINGLRLCQGGACKENFWCSSCCKLHKSPKAFSAKGEAIWVGPCCVGGCDCTGCMENLRSLVSVMVPRILKYSISSIINKYSQASEASEVKQPILDSLLPTQCWTCMLPCAHSSVNCRVCLRMAHKKCVKWEQAVALDPRSTVKLDGTYTSTIQKNGYLCKACTYKMNENDNGTRARLKQTHTLLFEYTKLALISSSPMDFELHSRFLTPLPSLSIRPISKTKHGLVSTSRRDDTSVGSGGTGRSVKPKKEGKISARKRKAVNDSDVDDSQPEDPLETLWNEVNPDDVIRDVDDVIQSILTCSRVIPFDRDNKSNLPKYFSHHKLLNDSGLSKVVSGNDSKDRRELNRIRNKRENIEKFNRVAGVDATETTIAVGRAARAKQRRIMKDLGGIVASTDFLSPDTLAGREPRLRFGRSQIHAWGIFADEPLAKGDMIVEYRGELISLAVANLREKKYEIEKIGSDYMFRIDNKTVCDATKQGNMARFFNASCEPNCMTKIINVNNEKRVVVYALKDIQSGEELVYDYKFPVEYDESKRIPCLCGSKNCRGFLNWVSVSQYSSSPYLWNTHTD